MTELEKIDLIRERVNVSYEEAREALKAANGDVVEALVILEKKPFNLGERVDELGEKALRAAGRFWDRTKKTRLKVKKGDRVLAEIPAPLGAVGVLGILASPALAVVGAVGTIAAMMNQVTLEVEKDLAPRKEDHQEGDTSGDGL